jgi:predicted Zn-dependent protease
MGERVAAKGVTVFDDGSIPGRRGSLTIDDEGTPDRAHRPDRGRHPGRLHARPHVGAPDGRATGNGRRQSYAHMPMPRMTNTGMLAGNDEPADMIASTKRGLYAANFGGGQVDITNGKFVFQCTEAYLIEDGKITAPVKGATLIGDGPTALTKVTDDRRRLRVRSRRRRLRQGGPGRAGRRGPAVAEDHGADGGRHGGLGGALQTPSLFERGRFPGDNPLVPQVKPPATNLIGGNISQM